MKPKLSLGLAVLSLVLCASPAALAGPRYDTTLSIAYSPSSGGRFAGHLVSHAGCVAGREVSVYRKEPGKDAAIGHDTAAASGRWRVAANRIAAGDYYAKTPRVSTAGGICAAAKSVTTRTS